MPGKRKKKEWSPNGYIFGSLRKIWRWSKARKEALENAKEPVTYHGKEVYSCVHCKGRFQREEVAIDHKEPVIDPKQGFTSWDTYIARLFCPSNGLQVLCKVCHKVKTQTENKIRRKSKKDSNGKS